MNSKQLLRLLKKDGWIHTRTQGSHYHLEKEGKKIILPYHNKELAKGTEEAILKQAGLK